jgi:hypothetical protein
LTPPEFVEVRGEGVMDRRNMRYVGAELRRVVWRDVEVRDVLLAAEDRAVWDALNDLLTAHGAAGHGLSLLDLVTAMSVESWSQGADGGGVGTEQRQARESRLRGPIPPNPVRLS